MSSFNFNWGIFSEKVSSSSVTFGNSDAWSVVRLNLERPDLTRHLFSSTLKFITEFSGNDLQISKSFLAGTVISPPNFASSTINLPVSSTSKSVPVSNSSLSFKDSNTLDKTGSV